MPDRRRAAAGTPPGGRSARPMRSRATARGPPRTPVPARLRPAARRSRRGPSATRRRHNACRAPRSAGVPSRLRAVARYVEPPLSRRRRDPVRGRAIGPEVRPGMVAEVNTAHCVGHWNLGRFAVPPRARGLSQPARQRGGQQSRSRRWGRRHAHSRRATGGVLRGGPGAAAAPRSRPPRRARRRTMRGVGAHVPAARPRPARGRLPVASEERDGAPGPDLGQPSVPGGGSSSRPGARTRPVLRGAGQRPGATPRAPWGAPARGGRWRPRRLRACARSRLR